MQAPSSRDIAPWILFCVGVGFTGGSLVDTVGSLGFHANYAYPLVAAAASLVGTILAARPPPRTWAACCNALALVLAVAAGWFVWRVDRSPYPFG